MNKIILILVFVIIVLGGGGVWYFKFRRPSVISGYQAVFLSNGQVYFGKLSNAGSNYVRLDDVYYLLRLQATESARPRFLLRKLGVELHGPENMLINRKQVLFTESLKEEGRVVKAIGEHKAQESQ